MDWGAEAAAAPGKETTEEAGATAVPGTPPAGHTAKSGPGSQAPPAGRGGHRAVSTRQLPQPLSQGCPSPPCPSPLRRPRRRAGVSSVQQRTGAGGGRSWHTRGDTGMPGPGPPVTSPPLPGRTLRFPTLPRGLGRPLGAPQPAVVPALPDTATAARPPPRADTGHSLVQLTQSGGHACRPCSHPQTRGRTRRPGGGARRGPHGGFITAAAHRRRRATPGPPGGRGRGRMQQCDTVKRGRGDTGRGRTRGGAQPPTRTGRPGSGKGEKRDSYFL